MNDTLISICCDCGNYINHKPRYADAFEPRSPYCKDCFDEFVTDESEGN